MLAKFDLSHLYQGNSFIILIIILFNRADFKPSTSVESGTKYNNASNCEIYFGYFDPAYENVETTSILTDFNGSTYGYGQKFVLFFPAFVLFWAQFYKATLSFTLIQIEW